MDDTTGVPIIDVVIYPTNILTFQSPRSPYSNRIEWNSPVTNFNIDSSSSTYWGLCSDPTSVNIGPWHGFTSGDVYRQHNLRDLGLAQPIPENP